MNMSGRPRTVLAFEIVAIAEVALHLRWSRTSAWPAWARPCCRYF